MPLWLGDADEDLGIMVLSFQKAEAEQQDNTQLQPLVIIRTFSPRVSYSHQARPRRLWSYLRNSGGGTRSYHS
jgi:hypothetical protein